MTRDNAGVKVDILVVDDFSEKPFEDSRVKVIRCKENLGFTGAINKGIEWAWNKYDYVLLLNNDIEPKKDFIKPLLKAFEDKDVGISSSTREQMEDGVLKIENFPVDVISGWAMSSIEDLTEEVYHVPWVPACCCLIRTDVIKQVGLLDRRMRNYCSDNDFCVRAGIMGYKTVLVPKSKVFHHHETTMRTIGAKATTEQNLLLSKVRSDYVSHILKNYPLDGGTGLMGELTFKTHEKNPSN